MLGRNSDLGFCIPIFSPSNILFFVHFVVPVLTGKVGNAYKLIVWILLVALFCIKCCRFPVRGQWWILTSKDKLQNRRFKKDSFSYCFGWAHFRLRDSLKMVLANLKNIFMEQKKLIWDQRIKQRWFFSKNIYFFNDACLLIFELRWGMEKRVNGALVSK